MARPVTWRQLIPGLVVSVVLAAAVLAVFVYARVGAIHGDTIRLYALADGANALVQGSEVWLAGRKVGQVRNVGFLQSTTDTSNRIVVGVDVMADAVPQIRRDSYAQIRPGGNLIGATVLSISVGTPATPALTDGDTISTRAQTDFKDVTARAAVAARDFPAIIANVKVLAAELGSPRSTVGAMISTDAGGEQMALLSTRSGRLAAQLTSGQGTIGRALRGGAADRARHATAQLDTLRQLLSSSQAKFGSFTRDSSLLRSVQGLRAEVSIVRALLDEPRGTAGRAIKDSAVTLELIAAQAELTALIADMKSRPFRYVTF